MTPTRFTGLSGDCRQVLGALAPGSVDAVVTDPPYGLAFMGKAWDFKVPGPDYWRPVLRALKPGGYLVAFGGTRTFHRQVCAIEDAGFEVRDCLNLMTWCYGSGFPKGRGCLKPAWEPITLARKPGPKVLPLSVDACKVPAGPDAGRWPPNLLLVHRPECEPDGGPCHPECHAGRFPQSRGATPAGRSGIGYGGGGKGTGKVIVRKDTTGYRFQNRTPVEYADSGSAARFYPQFYSGKASRAERDAGLDAFAARFSPTMGNGIGGKEHDPATATPKRNHHPTVKPLAVTRWLVRLVSSPGDLVLDPFLGSGTTARACRLEGRHCTGAELDPEYLEIARARATA